MGLVSRSYPGLFPAFLGKYPGVALWALMVFCGLGFISPGLSPLRLAVYALLISYVDEFSQIYQAPWINAVRGTYVGHLILGSTFSWFDMLAYTVGVALGVACRTIAVCPYWPRRPSGYLRQCIGMNQIDCVKSSTIEPPFQLSRFFRSLPYSRPPLLDSIRNSLSRRFAHDTFLLAFLHPHLLGSGVTHTTLIELAQGSYRIVDGCLLGF